ncbi:MAG: winged helix-turn-helix transcriptional regulator [Actinomycetota bacterium]|nr:winged helix-turn-helix transcriptional regulator [Actinomycetota bacterium]
MRGEYRQFCAIARTLDLVGQRWTLLVVRELLLRGPLPAAAIARGLPDVPMNQLVERLALLEARGLVGVAASGRDDGEGHARAYELTEAGRELGDVLEALGRFGLARLAGSGREPGDAVLPHLLMRQLELRYAGAAAGGAGLSGRFELTLTDPEELWSVEPGRKAPERFALVARPGGLATRPGACLDADAELRCTVDTCTRLIARDSEAIVDVEVTGDRALAEGLLSLLGAPVSDGAAVAAA